MPSLFYHPNNKIYYIVTDAQNTLRRLIDKSTGAVVWSWDSTAFGLGDPTGSLTFNLRFPGQYYDADSGQFYNLNRYYNPELGRYMEPDPTGLDGGLNPYIYAGNNPVMNVDPSGLSATPNGILDYTIPDTLQFNSMDMRLLDNLQMSFEQASSRFIDTPIVNNYSSTANMLALDLKPIPVFQNGVVAMRDQPYFSGTSTITRQDIADGLQTVGNVADGIAVGCAFSVVCAPAATAIGWVGFGAGTIGTFLDTSKNLDGSEKGYDQKVISVVIPYGVGRLGQRAVSNPAVSKAFAEAYGTAADKIAGSATDRAYACRKKNSC